MRNVIASITAAAVIAVAFVAGSTGEQLLPIIGVEQGVTAQLISGTGLFLFREGSTLTAFSPLTPGGKGDRVVYCPGEQIFVSPANKSLFTRSGLHVAGPAPRDLDRFRSTVTQDLELRVDVERVMRAHGRSKGTVAGEIGNRYYDWAANPAKPASFCQNPLRA